MYASTSMIEDEVDCIRRCQSGDLESFGALVEKYQRPVFNLMLRMVHRRDDAEELTQQTFLKAFEHLTKFEPGRKFFSWLYKIALNEALNFRSARREEVPVPETIASGRADPEQQAAATEARRDIETALGTLPPEQRAVVALRHLTQCSYDEIAEILNIPVKTVKSRLFSARQRLREQLGAKGHR